MSIHSVRLLGPIEVVLASGEVVVLPSQTQRRIVAVLGIYAPNTVRVESLCEICGVSPGALRKAVSRLRKVLGEALQTDALGYSLEALVDTQQFDRLFRHGWDTAGQTVGSLASTERLQELDGSVALWHGEVLAEFHGESWAQPTITRLTELRSAAIDEQAHQLILLDRASEAVAAMEGQVSREPLRDRSRGVLLRALAASGRQTDALRAYQAYREYLAAEAGTEPSPAVRDIERRIATGWNGQEQTSGPGFGTNFEAVVRSGSPQAARYGPTIAPLPPLLSKPTETSLVGRSNEISKLHHEFEKGTSTDSLRSVVIGGESGIGKTTLVATFAQSLRAQTNAIIVAGRCDEGESVVLKPFREIATFLVDHAPAALLEEHLCAAGPHVARLAPNLARRADVSDLAEEYPANSQAPSNDLTARYLLFEAMADLLRRFAKQQRVVLVLDDVQWAEPTTLLLLRHLNRALADTNIFLLVTYRDNESDRTGSLRAALAELERGQCTRLALGGIEELDFVTLVTKIVHFHTGSTQPQPSNGPLKEWKPKALTTTVSARQTDELAPSFVKQLFEETAGNPLYTLHLVRQLVESEATKIGHLGLQLKYPVEDLELPHSIRDVVWSRVSGLGKTTAELLSSAAILGREFRVDVLRSLVDLSEQEFNEGIEAGIRSGILQQPRVQFAQDLAGLRFTHAVVAHSLYEELTPFKRQRLHARTANTLALLDPVAQPELVIALARHFGLAGDFTPAMHWCRAAGNQALSNLAPNEAAEWYDKALGHALALQSGAPLFQETSLAQQRFQSLAHQMPPGPLGESSDGASSNKQAGSAHLWAIAELTLQLGKAQRLASKREARATLLRAAGLAQQIGSVNILIQSALANTRGFQQATEADIERLDVIDAALITLDQLHRADGLPVIHGLVESEEFEPLSVVGSLLADDMVSIQSNWQSIRARLLALLSQELLHTSNAVRRRASAEESLKIAMESPDTSLLVRIAPEVLNALWEPGGAVRSSEIARLAVESVHLLGEPLLTFRVYTGYFQAAVQNGDHAGARDAWRLAAEAATKATDPIVRWPLALKEVYEATMAGNLVAAESLAELAYSIGEESGESDALLIFATQIGSIRASQGRIGEILPYVEQAAVSNPDNLALQLFLAISCLEVGRTEDAHAILDRGDKLDFAHVPFDFLWTSTMALYAIIAVGLSDVTVSARLLELLEPFAAEICFNGATSLGCLSGQVGALASLVGRHDDAERYLLQALEVHRNFGWAFHEASALIGLARARLARVGMLDTAAHSWLDEAATIAETKGLLRVGTSVIKMRTPIT